MCVCGRVSRLVKRDLLPFNLTVLASVTSYVCLWPCFQTGEAGPAAVQSDSAGLSDVICVFVAVFPDW